MPRKKNPDNHPRKQRNFQVWVTDDEWERFDIIYAAAQSRLQMNLKITRADVIRRLVGLEPPDKLVTEDDINFFRHNTRLEEQVITELPPISTKVTQSDTSPKQLAKPGKKAANGD